MGRRIGPAHRPHGLRLGRSAPRPPVSALLSHAWAGSAPAFSFPGESGGAPQVLRVIAVYWGRRRGTDPLSSWQVRSLSPVLGFPSASARCPHTGFVRLSATFSQDGRQFSSRLCPGAPSSVAIPRVVESYGFSRHLPCLYLTEVSSSLLLRFCFILDPVASESRLPSSDPKAWTWAYSVA